MSRCQALFECIHKLVCLFRSFYAGQFDNIGETGILFRTSIAFPIRNMPEPIQYLTLLNPVQYFMEIVRGLFLKGSGVSGARTPLLGAALPPTPIRSEYPRSA
jgi:ABC-type polysaccharide/polyol phosphate export permease